VVAHGLLYLVVQPLEQLGVLLVQGLDGAPLADQSGEVLVGHERLEVGVAGVQVGESAAVADARLRCDAGFHVVAPERATVLDDQVDDGLVAGDADRCRHLAAAEQDRDVRHLKAGDGELLLHLHLHPVRRCVGPLGLVAGVGGLDLQQCLGAGVAVDEQPVGGGQQPRVIGVRAQAGGGGELAEVGVPLGDFGVPRPPRSPSPIRRPRTRTHRGSRG